LAISTTVFDEKMEGARKCSLLIFLVTETHVDNSGANASCVTSAFV